METRRFMTMLATNCLLISAVFCVCFGNEPPILEKPEEVVEHGIDAGPYPRPDSGYVTDLADLLSLEEEERIEQLLWRAEDEKGVEIAVVTIDSLRDYPGTAHHSLEAFATELFNRYQIGNMPRNDGVLLLIAKRDRKMRIELGAGRGKNQDATAARIIDLDIRPHFRAERYAEGIEGGVGAIVREFAGLAVPTAAAPGFPWPLVTMIVAALITAALAFSLFRSGKAGWGWLVMVAAGAAAYAIFRALDQHGRGIRGPGIGSSNWSSGGSGGGFGGGSSGGGGASGDW